MARVVLAAMSRAEAAFSHSRIPAQLEERPPHSQRQFPPPPLRTLRRKRTALTPSSWSLVEIASILVDSSSVVDAGALMVALCLRSSAV